MYSIAFVIPYFGKLPEMFPLWVQSAACNRDIDFLFFTDQTFPDREIDLPTNIKWHMMSFDELKVQIDHTVGFTTAVFSPYKLCDVRPCYGDVFKKYLAGYDFWGFCDIDLIFGQIRDFITDELLENYEKIGSMGHCVIIQNSDKMRKMYRQKIGNEEPYKTILFCKDNMSFDEGGNGDYGFPSICKANDVKEIWRRWFTDIYTETFEFRHKQYHENVPYFREIKLIEVKDGSVWITNKDDGSRFATMYVHFQGRIMENYVTARERYFVIPNRFVQNDSTINDDTKDREFYEARKSQKKKKSIMKKVRILLFLIAKGKMLDKGWRRYVC